MTMRCPNGHDSQAEDFCDTCGAKIDPDNQPAAAPEAESSAETAAPEAPAAPTSQACPNCGVENLPDALFCEACGYDFTTGALPRGAQPPASAGAASAGSAAAPTASPAADWVAEVWVDPDWYEGQETDEALPSPGMPTIVPLAGRSLLIGRTSASKNIHPDIDCTTDSGVSRRHAQLTSDGTRWFVEDLGSANGTFVGEVAGALPSDPIPAGPKKELDHDDRIYVGAWTRIVIREATDEEKAAATA